MRKKWAIPLLVAFIFSFAAFIFAGGPQRRLLHDKSAGAGEYVPGQVLVKFKKGLNQAAVEQIALGKSLKIKKRFRWLSRKHGQEYVLLESPDKTDVAKLVQLLRSLSQIEVATPNYLRFVDATPNDTNYSSLWGMHNSGQTGGTADADIDAPEAWDITTGSSGVVVVVIDSGIDYNHPDLSPNVWTNPGEIAGNGADDDGNGYPDDVYGIDAVNNDSNPMDDNGHGTHCSGTIGARGNNSLGVVGVNWNVKVMGLKFLSASGSGADGDAIECIQYAIDQKQNHGQNIVAINASWGGTGGGDSGLLRDAIEDANDAGIVFCAAAGNGGSDGIGDNNELTHHYPSDFTLPGIISVAATDHTDAITSFSNYGTVSVDIGAPGEDILSTVPGIYRAQSGDIFFDNVENGAGNWVVSSNNTWAISTNQEVFANPAFPVPSPTHFWSDSPGGTYGRNVATNLTYNANINLTAYSGQTIYFGIGAAAYIEDAYDHGYVQFSANGGSTWTTIADFTGFANYWGYYSWVIPESFKTAQFRMRFSFTSDNSVQYNGWLIDNIGIGTALTYSYESWGGTSMACPHVAGAIGLIADEYPGETVAQRKARILNWGDYNSSLDGMTVTCKRLNVYRSLYNPSVTVTSPNGGENWMVGTAHNITWTWLGAVNNVNIDYSIDGGTSWTSIATNQPNAGSYSWTVPTIATPQNNCLVRVREYGCTTSVTDQSNAVFSIVAFSSETVSAPSEPNGAQWGFVGVSNTYTVGGSASSLDHPVQYLIDWGDGAGAGANDHKVGSDSGWLPVGTTAASHAWSATGTYTVRAKARCATHPAIESAWSTSIPVTIDDEPTWAAVTRFGAADCGGAPAVEWQTGTEAGTVGYNLWRRDRETGKYEQVNPMLLPALANAPQGGAYRLADPGAFSFEPVTYKLEEIDSQGRSLMHGPFTVSFGGGSGQDARDHEPRLEREEPSEITGYQRFARAKSPYEEARLNARRQELSLAMLQAASAKERARVTVKGRGLFYVTSGQIASTLGVSDGLAASLVNGHNLKLTTLGKDVAWLADGNGAGLFFYNEGKETQYSDKNVYFIERGSGLAMEAVSGGNAGPAPDGQSYAETLTFKESHYFLPSQDKGKLADDWMWEVVAAGGAGKTFALDVPGVVGSGQARLRLVLRGATDTAAENDHHALVKVNGTD
ncbi:MAG TPA: S8 family serine peptidase, partial [Verrucomicrobiota bacterium]|nr:S8 family serine peptidase [Verrucomicrobiota bacterium]